MDEVEQLKEDIRQFQCQNTFCKGNVPGSYVVDSKMLFVGSQPSPLSDMQEPFTGKDKDIFDNLLTFLNLSRKTVNITNIIKCCCPKLQGTAIENYQRVWQPILIRELDMIQPKVVVSFTDYFPEAALEKYGSKYYRRRHPASLFYKYGSEEEKLDQYLNTFRDVDIEIE